MSHALTKHKTLHVIGAHLGWGAQIRETQAGPSVLKQYAPLESIWRDDVFASSMSREEANSFTNRLHHIHDFNVALANSVQNCLLDNHFPVIIGGDHSVAVGTWSGVTHALAAEQNFGLIWIDAHMDAHTYATSQSKAIHGMPVAALLGHGNDELTKIASNQAKLSPSNLVLIGIRSYEPQERELLDKLGVKVFYIQDVIQLGFKRCFEEALAIVRSNTKGFGVSIDLDAFDPADAPGVGSPETNGLDKAQVLAALSGLGCYSDFFAFEITEYNPDRDQENKTANLVSELMTRIFYVEDKTMD